MLAACVFLLILDAGCAAGFEEEPKAKNLYLTKCSKCHRLYEPASYTKEEWAGWMKKMKKKARLSDGQHDLIVRYVDSLKNKE